MGGFRFVSGEEGLGKGSYLFPQLEQALRDGRLIDVPEEGVGAVGEDRPQPPEGVEDGLGVVLVLDDVEALRSLVPIAAYLHQFIEKGLEDPGKKRHAFDQPVLDGMPDEGVLVVEEVEHHEESHFVDFCKLAVGEDQVLVLEAGESPEVGEPLDRGLLVRVVVNAERLLHCLGELVGEELAEGDDQVDDLGVHLRVVQQRPQFLQSQVLVVVAHFLYLGFHDKGLELGVDRVLALAEEALDHRLDGREGNDRVGHLDPQFDGVEPLGQGFRHELMRQVILNFYHGHGR